MRIVLNVKSLYTSYIDKIRHFEAQLLVVAEWLTKCIYLNRKVLFALNRIKYQETALVLRESNRRVHILNEEELYTCFFFS
jgi:hypothetical protein